MRVELLLSGNVLHGCGLDEWRGEIAIGRSSACAWSVPKDQIKVSSRHAVLNRDNGQIVFQDQGSTNGSFLLGERISRHTLRPGDEIHFGDCVLRLTGPAPAAAPARAQPRLRVRSGPLSGQVYVLAKAEVVIGSDASADVHIRDPMLSKRHAVLARQGDGGWSIKDLGSTNGTTVGGNKVEPQQSVPLGRSGQFYLAHHGFVVEGPGSANRLPLVAGAVGVAVVLGLAALGLSRSGGQTGAGEPEPARESPAPVAGSPLSVDAPDFAAALSAAQKNPSLTAALTALRDRHAAWRQALARLSALDFPGFDTAQAGISFAVADAPPVLAAWIDAWEERRAATLALRGKLEAAARARAEAGLELPPWQASDALRQVLAVDAWRSADGAPTAPEGGEYGRWLGAQTTFKRWFEESGKLSLTPLADSPRPARVDAWRDWLAGLPAVLAEAERLGLPDEGRLAEWRHLPAARDAWVRAQLDQAAQTPGRAGLLAAELAARLVEDPAAWQVGNTALPQWRQERFSNLLDEIERARRALLDAPEPQRPARREALFALALPGDPLITPIWLESVRP
jgi:pSer/pThr/pTyr-binding forkhead associated (FHA) protein